MQALGRSLSRFFGSRPVTEAQSRGVFTDARMRRDYNRRQVLREGYFERNQLNVLRKNSIIPKILRDVACEDVAKLPRDTNPVRIHQRCVVTSFPRNVSLRYRLGRHYWRHLADYNYLSGIQKAQW